MQLELRMFALPSIMHGMSIYLYTWTGIDLTKEAGEQIILLIFVLVAKTFHTKSVNCVQRKLPYGKKEDRYIQKLGS